MLPTLSWQSFETPPLKQRFKYFPSHKIILLVFISVPVSDAWKILVSPQANNTHMQLLRFISFCLPQEALPAVPRWMEKEGHLRRAESMSETGVERCKCGVWFCLRVPELSWRGHGEPCSALTLQLQNAVVILCLRGIPQCCNHEGSATVGLQHS